LLCQTNINECASNPCQNGATCLDAVSSFSCTCFPGFSGTLCQTNINECASNPCQNGGTCVDALNSFSCTWSVYSVLFLSRSFSHIRFLCSSLTPFTGLLCELDVDECLLGTAGCMPLQYCE
jgi:hypothetical protein